MKEDPKISARTIARMCRKKYFLPYKLEYLIRL